MIAPSAESELLDLVYATVLDRQQWVPVMERLADRIGGEGGALTRINHRTGAGEAICARSSPESQQAYHEYYGARNVLVLVDDVDRYLAGWSPTVLTDQDCVARDDFVRTEFFNDWWMRQGIFTAMFLRLAVSKEDVSVVNIGRPQRRGGFEAADLEFARWLQPHLIRAHKLGRRFAELEAASDGVSAALDSADRAYFVLDERGMIRHANEAARRLLSAGDALASIGGRLCAVDCSAARTLADLVVSATAAEAGGLQRGGAAAIPSAQRERPLSVTVAPLGARDAAIYALGRSALVCVTDLDAAGAPAPDELRRLFGLTAAEARVAIALYEGLSAKDIAEQFGVSHHTVRFQIARIHEKTGVSRQSELVRLVARVAGAAPLGAGE